MVLIPAVLLTSTVTDLYNGRFTWTGKVKYLLSRVDLQVDLSGASRPAAVAKAMAGQGRTALR
jgi:hypothetical protein